MPGARKLSFSRVMRFIVHLAMYLVMGPPIGAILLVLADVLHGSSEPSSSNGSALATAFAVVLGILLLSPYVVAVSYMIGGIAAFVGGAVVALVGPLIPYRPIRPVFAGVVGALSSYFLWARLQHLDQDDSVMAIVGGLSAVICSIFVESIESLAARRAA